MKLFLIPLFLICGCIFANAEIIEIANYKDGVGMEKSVKLFLKNNKASSIIISCETDNGSKGYVIQPINYVFALESYLNEIKDKYIEWTQTAISNEIEEYEKKLPAYGYQYGFMWYNPVERRGSSEFNAVWKYSKDSNMVIVSAKVIDSLGSYETAIFNLQFSNPTDIEMMIDAISESNIKSHIPTSIDSLFN